MEGGGEASPNTANTDRQRPRTGGETGGFPEHMAVRGEILPVASSLSSTHRVTLRIRPRTLVCFEHFPIEVKGFPSSPPGPDFRSSLSLSPKTIFSTVEIDGARMLHAFREKTTCHGMSNLRIVHLSRTLVIHPRTTAFSVRFRYSALRCRRWDLTMSSP
jgi:hypothetical protein